MVGMSECVALKLKLWARSRYILGFRRMVNRLGIQYTRYVRIERPLGCGMPTATPDVPVKFEVLTLEDAAGSRLREPMLASATGLSLDKALVRWRDGDICVAAIVESEDRLGGFCWLRTRQGKYEPRIATYLPLADGEGLIYDLIVIPLFRGAGLANWIIGEAVRLLESKGYVRAVIMHETDNVLVQKAALKNGFHATRMLVYFRLLRFRRMTEHQIGCR